MKTIIHGMWVFAVSAFIAAGCGQDNTSNTSDTESPATTQGQTAKEETEPRAEETRGSVVVTTGIWGDIVSNVACSGPVDVTTIIPVGGDPHSYEPSLRDRERMENAHLIVANGLALEELLADTIEAAEGSGTHVFHAGEHVTTIEGTYSSGGHEGEGHAEEGHDDHAEETDTDHAEETDTDHAEDADHADNAEETERADEEGHDDHVEEEGHDEDADHTDHEEGADHADDAHDDHADEEGHDDHAGEEEADADHDDHADEEGHDGHADEADHAEEGDAHGHAHDGADPHIWFDPTRVIEAIEELEHLLVSEVGLDAAEIAECRNSYEAELLAVDAEVSEILEAVAPNNRKLVTNHDALPYFADRYDFEVIGTVIPSPSTMAETNPAALAALAETIEHEGVRAIFAENLHSSNDAEALAARVGNVNVATLYTGSLGPEGSGAETYLGFMRTNATLIAGALG